MCTHINLNIDWLHEMSRLGETPLAVCLAWVMSGPWVLGLRARGFRPRLHRSLWGVQVGLQQFRQLSLLYLEQVGGSGGPHWETSNLEYQIQASAANRTATIRYATLAPGDSLCRARRASRGTRDASHNRSPTIAAWYSGSLDNDTRTVLTRLASRFLTLRAVSGFQGTVARFLHGACTPGLSL